MRRQVRLFCAVPWPFVKVPLGGDASSNPQAANSSTGRTPLQRIVHFFLRPAVYRKARIDPHKPTLKQNYHSDKLELTIYYSKYKKVKR